MGVLLQTLKSKGDLPTLYKDNTLYFSQAYLKGNTDNVVTNINKGKMQVGRFYFLNYM